MRVRGPQAPQREGQRALPPQHSPGNFRFPGFLPRTAHPILYSWFIVHHRSARSSIFSYAETHYKFNLPWSPLHKPWPEIFLDAPHQLLPGKDLTVWLLVKDADLYPVRVRSVVLRLWDETGAVDTLSPDLGASGVACAGNLQHVAFPLPRAVLERFQGVLRVSGRITVENRRGVSRVLENHNLPGLATFPLEVRLLGAPLPYPITWRAGEMHCHSEFSSDPVEFGAPLALMQQTAEAVGLDFVLCTDHSYDFNYRRDRYLEETDPVANFAAYRAQAEALNRAHPERPTIVPGEEVSCGNSRGENVHLLTFGHPDFLPGLGDGGRRGFRNRPTLSIGEVLERLGDTPSFAAHPKARIGWLERMIFRRGTWQAEDLTHPTPAGPLAVRGLQFWNGNLGADYQAGKAFWVDRLLAGQVYLPIGANDAHGDFNRSTGVKFPLVSLKQGRGHVFGRVRTLVPAPGRDVDTLREAFRPRRGPAVGDDCDRCVCTDGPFADLALEAFPTDGHQLRVAAYSTADFGALRSVHLYGAARGDRTERLLQAWTFEGAQGPFHLEELLPVPLARGYVRLEVLTHQGRRALTAAVRMG